MYLPAILPFHEAIMLAWFSKRCYSYSMRHKDAGRRYFATPELQRTIRRQGRMLSWFAEQIGVTQGHFSHVIRGRRGVAEDDARLIAAILGSDFFSLWDVSGGTSSTPEEAA